MTPHRRPAGSVEVPRRWFPPKDPPKDLDLDHALYVLSRWTIVQSRHPGWDAEEEDHRNRVLLNNVLAALGLKERIERNAPV